MYAGHYRIPPERPAASEGNRVRLLNRLAVKRQVETFAFNFGVDSKPDGKIDQLEQDQ
jgi:hypothetical protein